MGWLPRFENSPRGCEARIELVRSPELEWNIHPVERDFIRSPVSPKETSYTGFMNEAERDVTKKLRDVLVRAMREPPVTTRGRSALVERVSSLLAQGANPNATTHLMPQRPLIHAAAAVAIEKVVRLLLDAGADVHALATDGSSVLHAVAERSFKHIGSSVSSVDANAADVCGTARTLIAAGASPEGSAATKPPTGPPLLAAVAHGNHALVRELLFLGADPQAVCTWGGDNALHLAAAFVNGGRRVWWLEPAAAVDLWADLLAAGTNPNLPNEKKETPEDLLSPHSRDSFHDLPDAQEAIRRARALSKAEGGRRELEKAVGAAASGSRSRWRL